jgi:hypothetical protein
MDTFKQNVLSTLSALFYDLCTGKMWAVWASGTSSGEGTPRKLATATQPTLPRNYADFKEATGFQISWRTLRKLFVPSLETNEILARVRPRAHPGNWKPHRNRDFVELSTCYWMEQRNLKKRQHNSWRDWETKFPGNGACQSSHNCVAAWFPSISCSVSRFRD